MAIDYARYMIENPDVYDMFRKPGGGRPNWTWDNGRKAGQYRRNDGTMTQNTTAAEYAQQHYDNFGRREGRKQHQRTDGSYEARIRQIDGGGGGGINPEVDALQKLVMGLTESLGEAPTAEQVKEIADAGANMQRTVLTDNYLLDDEKKKKKSFLQPIG